MRVLEKNHPLTLMLEHEFGNLCVAAQRTAEISRHPRLVFGPTARPRKVVEQATRGARGHAPRKLGQHVEVLVGKGHHLVLERIVGNQRQRLPVETKQPRQSGVRRQPRTEALDLNPLYGPGQGGNERPAVRDALPLERQRLWKDRGRVNRIDEIDGAIERGLPIPAFCHAGHQFHQPAFAAIRVADQSSISLQHALARDGIVRAAYRV